MPENKDIKKGKKNHIPFSFNPQNATVLTFYKHRERQVHVQDRLIAKHSQLYKK